MGVLFGFGVIWRSVGVVLALWRRYFWWRGVWPPPPFSLKSDFFPEHLETKAFQESLSSFELPIIFEQDKHNNGVE